VTVKFNGFSMPEGSFFPPEFRELLPDIDTVAELKVILYLLDRYFQAGLDAQPLTLDQIQEATGLSRYGVNEGLKRARQRGTIKRRCIGGRYGYEPNLDRSLKIRLSCHESSSFPDSFPKPSDTHASESELRAQIYKALVAEFGVSARVADDIATGREVEYVQRHIDYARAAVASGFAKSRPGYVVASIRDDWGPPLGYVEPKEKARWYTDEEFELFFEHGDDPRFEGGDDGG
jgi:hypothetical protein